MLSGWPGEAEEMDMSGARRRIRYRMRGLAALALLALAGCGTQAAAPCDPETVNCLVMPSSRVQAVDGDTFAIGARRFRLLGWDSPESGNSARCHAEHEIGLKAEAQAILLTRAAKTVTFHIQGRDEFDRETAYIYLDNIPVGQLLAKDGLSAEHSSGKDAEKPDWCRQL